MRVMDLIRSGVVSDDIVTNIIGVKQLSTMVAQTGLAFERAIVKPKPKGVTPFRMTQPESVKDLITEAINDAGVDLMYEIEMFVDESGFSALFAPHVKDVTVNKLKNILSDEDTFIVISRANDGITFKAWNVDYPGLLACR